MCLPTSTRIWWASERTRCDPVRIVAGLAGLNPGRGRLVVVAPRTRPVEGGRMRWAPGWAGALVTVGNLGNLACTTDFLNQ